MQSLCLLEQARLCATVAYRRVFSSYTGFLPLGPVCFYSCPLHFVVEAEQVAENVVISYGPLIQVSKYRKRGNVGLCAIDLPFSSVKLTSVSLFQFLILSHTRVREHFGL